VQKIAVIMRSMPFRSYIQLQVNLIGFLFSLISILIRLFHLILKKALLSLL